MLFSHICFGYQGIEGESDLPEVEKIKKKTRYTSTKTETDSFDLYIHVSIGIEPTL